MLSPWCIIIIINIIIIIIASFVEEEASAEPAAASTTNRAADTYDLGIKNEVSMLHELCGKKGIRLQPVIASKVNADGQVSFTDQSVFNLTWEYELVSKHGLDFQNFLKWP